MNNDSPFKVTQEDETLSSYDSYSIDGVYSDPFIQSFMLGNEDISYSSGEMLDFSSGFTYSLADQLQMIVESTGQVQATIGDRFHFQWIQRNFQ